MSKQEGSARGMYRAGNLHAGQQCVLQSYSTRLCVASEPCHACHLYSSIIQGKSTHGGEG